MSGHDSASDFIIAALLAWLKSDHMAAGPVRRTVTSELDSRARRSFNRVAASTISDGAAPASPVTIAVRPSSRDRDAPPRREHSAHGMVAAKHALHSGERRPHRAMIAPGALVGHDDRQRVRSLSREMRLDRATSFPGLRAWSFPAGARERLVRERRERPEAEHKRSPEDDDEPPVVGGPCSKTSQVVRCCSIVAHASDGTAGERAHIGHSPDLVGGRYAPVIRPCLTANRLACARLETPIFV